MKEWLSELYIELLILNDFNIDNLSVEEIGKTALENARLKSLAYYEHLKIPVFSCDSSLYFEGVDDSDQPGVEIRRVNGEYFNDEKLINHYANLAKKYGGKLTAKYINAISFVVNNEEIYEYFGEEISSERFLIIDKPKKEYKAGYPLDALSVDIATSQQNNDTERNRNGQGFRDFFEKYIKIATENQKN